MILSPVSRCGVRREEEIGARLSDGLNMNSTDLIDNPDGDMSAMRFRGGWLCGRAFSAGGFPKRKTAATSAGHPPGKRKGPARGESGALRGTDQRPVRRERSGRKGGRRNTRCDDGAYRGQQLIRQPGCGYASYASGACARIFPNNINGRLLAATGCHRAIRGRRPSRSDHGESGYRSGRRRRWPSPLRPASGPGYRCSWRRGHR